MKSLIKTTVALFLFGFALSCSDKVDTSDMFTFKGQTVTDYIKADTSLSLFYHILSKSKIKPSANGNLSTLLSTRGNYTVFAPTNAAVNHYLDSIFGHQPYDIDTSVWKQPIR